MTDWKEARANDPFLFLAFKPRPLTVREKELIVKIAEGLRNKAIAFEMGTTPETVKCYISRLLNKLGFSSRLEVAIWAREHQDFFGPIKLRCGPAPLQIGDGQQGDKGKCK